MSEKDLRIIYMGTPEFAVAPLKLLMETGHNIVAVVSAPDKPSGRGKKIHYSAVKKFATENNLNILQPVKLKDDTFINELQSLEPDIQIVVAFRMLPKAVWSIPELGTFNLHASLLPQYRGAAPINWAIINGESETGVTTFMIDEEIDTGKILLQKKQPIDASDNAEALHDRLMSSGADLVLQTIKKIAGNDIVPISQEQLLEEGLKIYTAPKIHRSDCLINWDSNGKDLFNFIRGLSPYPGAFTTLTIEKSQKILFKIFETQFIPEHHQNKPGTIFTDQKKNLRVAVNDGWISVISLQIEGKKVMSVSQFLAGFSFTSSSGWFS